MTLLSSAQRHGAPIVLHSVLTKISWVFKVRKIKIILEILTLDKSFAMFATVKRVQLFLTNANMSGGHTT